MLHPPPRSEPTPPPPPGLTLSGTIRRPALQILLVVLLESLLIHADHHGSPSPLAPLVFAVPLAVGLWFNTGSIRLAMIVAHLAVAFLTLMANIWIFGWAD